MYDRIRKIMHCISTCFVGERGEPVRLRVGGATTTLTPEPDDAELAAEALLQSMKGGKNEKIKKSKNEKKERTSHTSDIKPQPSKEYYEQLAKRMQEGHEMERRMATRFVAYCEQELALGRKNTEPQNHLAELERGLYKWQDTIEREGGELKKRWQRCLADITVRQMEENWNEEAMEAGTDGTGNNKIKD